MKTTNKKHYYKLNKIFNRILEPESKTFTIWRTKKRGDTLYQILMWKEEDGLYIKYGKSYGFDSCWKTILP